RGYPRRHAICARRGRGGTVTLTGAGGESGDARGVTARPEPGPGAPAAPEPGPGTLAAPEPGPTASAGPEPGAGSLAAPEPGPTAPAGPAAAPRPRLPRRAACAAGRGRRAAAAV